MADHVFDETTVPPGACWEAEGVQNGDIIFVKTDMLTQFFTTRHPHISNRYILISHNRCAVSLRKEAYPLTLENVEQL
jgi:accessory colonization factor AcfC